MSLAKRLAAWWDSPGEVRWHLPMGSGWQAGGRFTNCVSKKCLMRRVRLMLEAPRGPPSRVYRLAGVALDYLVGMASDAELESYEVKLGVNIGAADKYGKALADAVISRLTGGKVQESSGGGGGRTPELFLAMSLAYDVYDCPHSGETCEGWWVGVTAVYSTLDEWCTVEWSRYVGADVRAIARDAALQDAILHAAHRALRHAYNTQP
jgi:hypothetical protein